MASRVHPDIAHLRAAALDILFDWHFWEPAAQTQAVYAWQLLQSYWESVSAHELYQDVQSLFPSDAALIFRAHCSACYPGYFDVTDGGASFRGARNQALS